MFAQNKSNCALNSCYCAWHGRSREIPALDNSALAAIAECEGGLITRSVRIAGRRTSCRLDAATWSALTELATDQGATIDELCSQIAATKPPSLNVTVAIRSSLLAYFQRRAAGDTVH